MLLAIAVAFAAVPWTGFAGRTGPDWYALPGDTVPESYALAVEPELGTATGSLAGRVYISIGVRTTTAAITLNAQGLTVQQVRITDRSTGADVTVDSWDCADERLTIYAAGRVLANRKYTVYVRFVGTLRDDDRGFFQSFYTSRSVGKV